MHWHAACKWGLCLFLFCLLCIPVSAQYITTDCHGKVQEYHDNGNFTYDDYWHDRIRGLHWQGDHIPITLSYKGCRKACGGTPRYNDALTGCGILTTWVLPVIALVSNLPFEKARPEEFGSNRQRSRKARRKLNLTRTSIFEPMVNWLGSPQSAITSILSNITLQTSCARVATRISKNGGVQSAKRTQTARDAYFLLCCINQYELTEHHVDGSDEEENGRNMRRKRDHALLVGLLCPLYHQGTSLAGMRKILGEKQQRAASTEAEQHENTPAGVDNQQSSTGSSLANLEILQERVEDLLTVLAHQLRLLRRRGMYPLIISILWFFVSFAVGLYSCFRALGDYTTSHSLAIGMLLSWLPILVLMSIADRNPNGIERCRSLIERWLYNVDAAVEASLAQSDTDPNWWSKTSSETFSLGHYVGQGRYFDYCGTGHFLFQFFCNIQTDAAELEVPDIALLSRKRHRKWWLTWLCGELIVSVAVFAAFMISFNTPTIGLGCRSFFYLVAWMLSSISWVLQGIFTELPRWAKILSLIVNTVTACLFGLFMFFQAGGVFNTCFCQSSLFGSEYLGFAGQWGGYVQFGPSSFYEAAYRTQNYWYPASGISLLNCFIFLTLTILAWRKGRPLWDETWSRAFSEESVEQVEMHEMDGVSLRWLT